MNKLLFIVFTCGSVAAQDTIVIPKIDVFKRNIIELSYGIPLGELSDKYESSINTAFYVRTKIGKKQYIDFGAELSGIVKGRAIEYEIEGAQQLLDGSKSAFLLGFRYSRFLYQSKNENFHIESNTGLGWKYLHYSLPEDELFEDVDVKPTLHTIAVTQGMKIMFYGFGVHCSYHYSPYTLFNSKAENSFGGASFNIGLSGSWNF